ncbi:MAG: 23S rRNA (adenine(2030)-N(6))-methyltransferase RlmJ [Acidiferrobacteraceae bacterium]
MNYRHGFHAGNAADVFKHYVLCRILASLRTKPTPFFVLDSHAGAGGYRLAPGCEHESGIGHIWNRPPVIPDTAEYLAIVGRHNPKSGVLLRYPGSPLIVRALLRSGDRAVFVEQHPEEHNALRALLGRDPRLSVHLGNGWNLINAFTPPPERRGLVLIDPPYEQRSDFEQVSQALARGRRHWRGGIYCAWYPIKSEAPVRALLRDVAEFAPEALVVQMYTLPRDVPGRLNGSGLVLVNPPWQLPESLMTSLPELARRLSAGSGAGRVLIAKASEMSARMQRRPARRAGN